MHFAVGTEWTSGLALKHNVHFTVSTAIMPNYTLACYDEEMNPRRRSTMEDIHRIVPSLGGDENLSYFGVYDGHGGRQIADFLEETLENNIYQELRHHDDATIPQRIAR